MESVGNLCVVPAYWTERKEAEEPKEERARPKQRSNFPHGLERVGVWLFRSSHLSFLSHYRPIHFEASELKYSSPLTAP